MRESESLFYFLGDALDVYEGMIDLQQVIELWEQLSFLQERNDVDYETTFEISDGLESYKVMYGSTYTIVFQNEPDGSLVVFSIRRPRLLRFEG